MQGHTHHQSEGALQELVAVKPPHFYTVVLLNDDFTPMEFVTWILETVFYKTPEESVKLMLDVHHRGRGVCGVFTYDIARSKASQVEELARQHQHPLHCVIEPVSPEDSTAP
ncbi:MAG: ATP-dependent Clp protease adapter ClpS [Candidatus Margulisiibacteriota bacterium]